jgi:ribonuclease BN (tRNA processing enzyme)
MSFHDLREGQVVTIGEGAGEVRVSNTRGNHPNGVFAYRIDHRNQSVVYCTDTEHYAVIDPKLSRLADKADVLIYDAMYLPEEYSGQAGGGTKTGWGHSTYEEGAKLAKQARVQQLVLFHHDPLHTDADVRNKENRTRKLFPNSVAAREGLVIEL